MLNGDVVEDNEDDLEIGNIDENVKGNLQKASALVTSEREDKRRESDNTHTGEQTEMANRAFVLKEEQSLNMEGGGHLKTLQEGFVAAHYWLKQ